jgi:hypothetical protein
MMKLGLYKHYSGKLYQVIGVARHSETLEEVVVYQALYNDYGFWVRPKVMFLEKVEHQGKIIDRFQFVQALGEESPKLNV